MVCLGSRRIEPLLGGPVIDPHRGAVACPAGGIGFAGSSKENPVLTIHHLEIVNHYTAIVDAGKADELALGLNRAKGPAYERWAKVYNLKQMAAALQYLRENDLMDYEALAASTEKAVERFHTLSEELRQTEAELEKTFGLMAATVDYAKTRPVFDGYKAARYSKKYLSEHEAELAAYRAARVTMNELLDGAKLPKMADMKKSRQELAGKKKALYAEYRKAQADMRQAVAVKANIDHLLGVTDGRENKAQER